MYVMWAFAFALNNTVVRDITKRGQNNSLQRKENNIASLHLAQTRDLFQFNQRRQKVVNRLYRHILD